MTADGQRHRVQSAPGGAATLGAAQMTPAIPSSSGGTLRGPLGGAMALRLPGHSDRVLDSTARSEALNLVRSCGKILPNGCALCT